METGFVVVNSVRGPFTDPTLRRALAFALDRTAIARVFGQLPSDELLPPGAKGFRDRHRFPLTPALAKAAALMHGRRVKAVLACPPRDAPHLQEARLLQAELGAIGIRLELKLVHADFQKLWRALRAAARGGPQIDLADGGTFYRPDGAAFLANAFSPAWPSMWFVRPDVSARSTG